MFSRDQLKRAASLTEEDFAQLGKCRRPHNRLGFAYQVAFVRLLGWFPQQQPFELFEELVCFSAAQLGLDAGLIELYRKRQPTISEHQQTITGYLRLRPFDDAEAAQLEQFLFEEACRLEQAAALWARRGSFLKSGACSSPLSSGSPASSASSGPGRHGMLRKFSPALLDALELTQDIEGEQSACLRALQMLKELNAAGRRKLPEDAPTEFLPQRLKPIVIHHGEIDRRAWECALLLKLRDELKAGNLSVRYSKRFAPLEEFFIDDLRWKGVREDFFRRSGLPSDSKQVPEYLARRLAEAYERFLNTAPSNSYAVVDKDGWSLSAEPTEKLDQEEQDRLAHLKSWLAKHMRRVKLPDLLIEVDNRLGFTRNFLTPAQREEPSPEDICAVLAAVMAHGCNLGVYTMAQLTSNVTYEQLKRIGDWHLTEEAQRSALAELVSAITDLDTSARWGEGKTAASDGQRFSLPRRVLQQTYSTRFSDFALEFYTFVADNYAPFYSLPVECTDRDAAFVLDGLLYNESELEIEEHYTDTHGYTEINFAAFAMLGLRFCPRIRGVQHQRIYRIDPNRDYGSLASLISRADQTIDTEQIAEHWDRMGQLYASLKSGHVTASVALKRLVGFSAKNRFYRANRDLGRIFKSEFILQYLSEPELRRRIRRGLLKVEQLHALARDVFYGRRGRINARELWEQMNTCSCLNLVLACIVYWQACEISRVLSECDPVANAIDLSLLEHVSPIEWDNVVLYGQYILDRKLVRQRRRAKKGRP